MKMNSKLAASALIPIVLASLAFPTVSIAKNDKKENREQQKLEKRVQKIIKVENKRAEANEKKECARAFGHLISPGWIKKNGTPGIDPNCKLPYGIWKKLFGNNGSATTTKPADTVAPIISNIVSHTGTTFAVVTWNTNEKASAKIYWSTSTPVSTSTANMKSLDGKNFAHFTVLSGLSATTTYYAVIEATDAAGNKSASSQFSFKTDGTTVVVNDTVAPVITNITSEVKATSTKITWTTNEPATSKVYFGTSSPLNLTATTTASTTSSSLVNNHSVTLTNLSTSTTYYFVVESKDTWGNTATSTQFSTTTLVD